MKWMKLLAAAMALLTLISGMATAEADASAPLSDMKMISGESNFRKGDVEDAYGNTYAGPHFELCSYGKGSKKGEYITQSSVEFALGGAYSCFTGTFFTRPDQADEFTVEFMVYADDELIYCSEPISRRTKAVDFAIEIGQCDVLKIAARSYDHTKSGTNPGILLANAALCNDYEGEWTAGVPIDPDRVPLTDLHVFGTHSNALTNTSAGAVEDSFGNLYKGIYAELVSCGTRSGKDYDTQAYTEYVAGGEYNYLSGTIFTRPGQDAGHSVEFLVYADDELAYASGMIDGRDGAVDFVAEINGCELIKIMSRSLDRTDSGTNPGIILVNPVVSENDPRAEAQ